MAETRFVPARAVDLAGQVDYVAGSVVSVTLRIGGEEVRAREGEIVLMPANVPHAIHANERFKMLLVMIRG